MGGRGFCVVALAGMVFNRGDQILSAPPRSYRPDCPWVGNAGDNRYPSLHVAVAAEVSAALQESVSGDGNVESVDIFLPMTRYRSPNCGIRKGGVDLVSL
jgi:hypothetical protein